MSGRDNLLAENMCLTSRTRPVRYGTPGEMACFYRHVVPDGTPEIRLYVLYFAFLTIPILCVSD
jgi:hypothetical protein